MTTRALTREELQEILKLFFKNYLQIPILVVYIIVTITAVQQEGLL